MNNHSLTMAASHVVRLYLWDMLTEHMRYQWKPGGEHGDIPIIPTQEQPEEQASGKPYIVYTYDYNMTTGLWQLQNETIYLRVISQSAATIAATTKLIMRVFNRMDESAVDINEWIRSPEGLGKYEIPGADNAEYNVWMDEARNFQFKFTRISGVTGMQPAASEGGRSDSIISIELHYVELDHAGNGLSLESNN